ncbi:MAG: sulfite exporter TauE/SafE family protein [Deltaproteobacteria bacterium]|nr:sulfite exporter TauE/SafE family protein [Deltaproteobacteria bacterium]
MEMTSVPVVLALWLGILTSISPCPLAANIAAVSFIVKGGGSAFSACASGIAYTLGRAVAYVALGVLISASFLNLPAASYFLQTTMPKFLGPVLIITGLLLFGVFSFSMPGLTVSQDRAEKLRKAGVPGALAMGILFALAFCPVSAAFFRQPHPACIKAELSNRPAAYLRPRHGTSRARVRAGCHVRREAARQAVSCGHKG